MPAEAKIFLLIIGMWLVNYIPRMMPMLVLSRFNMPEIVVTWLSFVPPAVLAALIAPDLLMKDGHLMLSLENKNLLAAIPTFAIARKTNSLVWTLIAGMLAMALLRLT